MTIWLPSSSSWTSINLDCSVSNSCSARTLYPAHPTLRAGHSPRVESFNSTQAQAHHGGFPHGKRRRDWAAGDGANTSGSACWRHAGDRWGMPQAGRSGAATWEVARWVGGVARHATGSRQWSQWGQSSVLLPAGNADDTGEPRIAESRAERRQASHSLLMPCAGAVQFLGSRSRS